MSLGEEPTWQTDFSQIKSNERNDIAPLLPISDGLADQLLFPLLGYCLGQTVDIWKYTLCVGAFSRQEMLPGQKGPSEVYSLGINNKLPKEKFDSLAKQLENAKEVTEDLAK